MTILGNFNFQHKDIKNRETHDFCDVVIFADGRISTGNGKLTDAAPKLQILDVCVRKPSGEELRSQVVIGFAGTSALTALSAIGFISHVLRQLVGESLPTVDQIASFVTQAFRSALEEYSQNQIKSANASVSVAGFNKSTKESIVKSFKFKSCLESYLIEPLINESSLTLVSEPQNWDLKERFIKMFSVQSQKPFNSDSVVNEIDRAIRAISGAQPYGGQLQVILLDEHGPRLIPTKVWDFSFRRADLPIEWSKGDYRTTLLGYNVFDLRVGQCDFRTYAAIQLDDTHKTAWAKGQIESEERPPDDGDFSSRPRTKLININF